MGVLTIVKRLPPASPEKPAKTGTLVHSMKEGDTVMIGDDIEINLKEGRSNRATIQIKAPVSIPIKRKV